MEMGDQVPPHPNIVEFMGVIEHPCSGLLLVYEFIDGMNLEDYL